MSRHDLDYMQAEIDALRQHNDELREQLGEWRQCAERLADWMGVPKYDETFEQSVATKNAALAEFERLKEGGE